MSVTSVRFSSELETPLEELAKKSNRSKNFLINQAVKEFIQRKEMAEQQWQDTLVALNSVQNDDLIDESKVNNWLQSWGSNNEKIAPKT